MDKKQTKPASTKERWGSKFLGRSRKADSGADGKTFQVKSTPKKLLVDTEGSSDVSPHAQLWGGMFNMF